MQPTFDIDALLTSDNLAGIGTRWLPVVELDPMVRRVGPIAAAHGWGLWQTYDELIEFASLGERGRPAFTVRATRELLDDAPLDAIFDGLEPRRGEQPGMHVRLDV